MRCDLIFYIVKRTLSLILQPAMVSIETYFHLFSPNHCRFIQKSTNDFNWIKSGRGLGKASNYLIQDAEYVSINTVSIMPPHLITILNVSHVHFSFSKFH